MFKAMFHVEGADAPGLTGELRSRLPPAFYHASGDAHVFIFERSLIRRRIVYYMTMVIVEFSDTRNCRIRVIADRDSAPYLDTMELIEKMCQSRGWQCTELDNERL